jgi:hypothetical protein
MFEPPGLQHVLLVVTDGNEPELRNSWLHYLWPLGRRSAPVIVITPEQHRQFYGGCRNLLTAVLAQRSHSSDRRGC